MNNGSNNRCAQLLQQIREIDFCIVEIALFLDAYPDHPQALEYYRRLTDERAKARRLGVSGVLEGCDDRTTQALAEGAPCRAGAVEIGMERDDRYTVLDGGPDGSRRLRRGLPRRGVEAIRGGDVDGMMGHKHVCPGLRRSQDVLVRSIEGARHTLHGAGAVADGKPDMVPRLGIRGGKSG